MKFNVFWYSATSVLSTHTPVWWFMMWGIRHDEQNERWKVSNWVFPLSVLPRNYQKITLYISGYTPKKVQRKFCCVFQEMMESLEGDIKEYNRASYNLSKWRTSTCSPKKLSWWLWWRSWKLFRKFKLLFHLEKEHFKNKLNLLIYPKCRLDNLGAQMFINMHLDFATLFFCCIHG